MTAKDDIYVKGERCILLEADKYSAVIAPTCGSAVWRLRDNENDIEVFRYGENVCIEQVKASPEVWGLPFLYLPNRFDGGVLKTSDGEYKFPINEPKLKNFIHGWVHKRAHKIEKVYTTENTAIAVTSFTHDETDEMFKYFPLRFKLTLTFELSKDGLSQTAELKNLSDKRLPVSICTHTCISAPMKKGTKQSGLRLSVPIGERCELDKRELPTEKLLPLTYKDMRYKNGTMRPVLHTISNDMYTACENVLDDEPFYGVVITDRLSGRKICNEVSREYKFWNMWNDKGYNGYFCPEPMTAMINAPNLSLPREVTGYEELEPNEKYSCSQRFFTL